MARTARNPDGPSRFALVAVVAAGLLVLAAGALLALAWRNAGWIGLDRWLIPWVHRRLYAGPRASGETRPTSG